MTEFQLALLIVGAVAVAAVLLYNKVQERIARERDRALAHAEEAADTDDDRDGLAVLVEDHGIDIADRFIGRVLDLLSDKLLRVDLRGRLHRARSARCRAGRPDIVRRESRACDRHHQRGGK